MTTKEVIAVLFPTPHLTDVELTDPDTPVTFCGRQVIGRKQMNVRDYLISTHLYYGGRQRPWQQHDSCSRSFSFTKPSYSQNCFDSDGLQMPAHSSESDSSPFESSGNPCDDCAPACNNNDSGRSLPK